MAEHHNLQEQIGEDIHNTAVVDMHNFVVLGRLVFEDILVGKVQLV